MVALFAVGVVTGTILAFELGMLWPEFMATFGDVFGLGFALEGFAFFLEAIFIAIYVYGWDRLSPRMHFLSGIPIVVDGRTRRADGDRRQRLDEQPERLQARGRRGPSTCEPWSALFGNGFFWHELVHMYFAAYIVVGFLLARRLRVGQAAARQMGPLRAHRARDPADDRRAGRAGAAARRRLGGARGRDAAAGEARRVRGAAGHDEGRAEHLLGWYEETPARSRAGSRSPTCCRCSPTTTRTRRSGARRRCRRTTARRDQRRPLRVPDDGRDRHAAGGVGALVLFVRWRRATAAGVALVLPRARAWPGRWRSSR